MRASLTVCVETQVQYETAMRWLARGICVNCCTRDEAAFLDEIPEWKLRLCRMCFAE